MLSPNMPESDNVIKIAIWIPKDIPGLELSIMSEIFQQTNLILEQKKYLLSIIKQPHSDNDINMSMLPNMSECEWIDEFDYLFIASNSLPESRVDSVIKEALDSLLLRCHKPVISINTGVFWLLNSGYFNRNSVVTHWVHWDDVGEQYPSNTVLPQLYFMTNELSCCTGKFALVDFLLEWLSQHESSDVVNTLADLLCIDRVRSGEEKQRLPAVTLGGEDIQPRLTMAIELMESNVEEPLSTDEIAEYVHISRRQLERLFKRYLNVLPARYYLQLRLKRAQHLLVSTSKSIVQIGLMCGFSSGPHFSSSYKSYYGITPRDERAKRFRNNK